ncbi:MAG TPA: hypothetical protein VFL51_17435 [Pseudolabrys sp.]|nr:hypothetical protein [Pseudolabrys sp.]
MFDPLLLGLICLGIGLGLIAAGWPRGGTHPRFLQFRAAVVLYPPLVLIFLAAGVAQLIAALD